MSNYEEAEYPNSKLREAAKMVLLIGLVAVGLTISVETVILTIIGLISYLLAVV